MLNETFFSHVKKGAFLVNTARGELVDDDALLTALETGVLAGARVSIATGTSRS
eukprot:m.1594309 g.1594309  ORF g.1594309 m.1594309 type:complete len:54 (-) comp25341_c0_seq55:2011-2172(-)